MIERQENKIQPRKNRGPIIGLVIFITIYIAIVFVSKFVGKQEGREAAIVEIQKESIADNAPTGFMGAKWLMPISQVEALFPDAYRFDKDNLKLDTIVFDRPAFVDFKFKNNSLLMIIITFKGEKNKKTYRLTHDLVMKEYGVFPEATSTSKYILISKKRIGRIAIRHQLYKIGEMSIEQVMLYRTKSSKQK